MLTKNQIIEINQAMIEPDDLMDKPSPIDQLSDLANAVLMLESKAREIEAIAANYYVSRKAYEIRYVCQDWRTDLTAQLRKLNAKLCGADPKR